MTRSAKTLIFVTAALALTAPVFLFAQSSTAPLPSLPINTNLPVPNAVPISGPNGQGPAGVIANFYSFAFLLAGFLAFIVIIYGGVRYTFSAGNVSVKNDARDAIEQALMGLGLLLVAYLILRTINPDLTTLRLPTLTPYVPPAITASGGGPTGPAATCQGLTIAPVTGDAIPFENGQTVSYTSSNTNIQQNLSRLQVQVAKATQALSTIGASLAVQSAYRPLAYQQHLYNVWNLSSVFKANPSLAASCSDLKSQDDAEMAKHQIQSVVAIPNCSAPHVRGIAVDLTITGTTYPAASALFQRLGVDLLWKNLSGDAVHFEMQHPPYTGSDC